MSAEATKAVMNELLGNYPPNTHQKRRLVTGTYTATVDDAKKLAQDSWAETFGEFRPFPAAFGTAYYLIDYEEKVAVLQHQEKIRQELTPEARAIFALVETLQPYTKPIQAAPAYLQLQAYRQAFDITTHTPDLRVPEGVKSGPHIRNDGLQRSTANTVCAFASNLLYYRPDDIAPQDFDGMAARDAIRDHENGFNKGWYNLAWMLGMLATPFATSGRVRAITTIGCDFREIEERVLTPIRQRSPDVEYTLNALVASRDRLGSLHPVGIVGNGNGGSIIVNDPQHKEPQTMPAEDFWYQWTAANMQMEVTIAPPIREAVR